MALESLSEEIGEAPGLEHEGFLSSISDSLKQTSQLITSRNETGDYTVGTLYQQFSNTPELFVHLRIAELVINRLKKSRKGTELRFDRDQSAEFNPGDLGGTKSVLTIPMYLATIRFLEYSAVIHLITAFNSAN
ncbi:hypothetical protein ACFL96_00015 [Thermoproteota archaeon]